MPRRLDGHLLTDPHEPPRPGWIVVDNGLIQEVGHGSVDDPVADPSLLICPAFVDAHLHLPQIESIGFERPDLLTWLDTVIYPAELAWSDPAAAERQLELAHRRLLRAGTMSYAGYLTSHPGDQAIFASVHARWPLEALVGPCLMDTAAPPGLTRHAVPTLASNAPRRRTSVNPRFAIACSDELLGTAGQLATGDRIVQTHLAEHPLECDAVRRRFPDETYTAVYDRFGLVGPRTLLAHGIHLDATEWQLIAERDAVVVHCPTANTFLGSGLFDLGAARRHGVRVALGSDIAAGPDLAMPRVARAMIEVAKMRRMTIDPYTPVPTPADAWTMITAGNADAIGLTRGGRLVAGAPADIIVLAPPWPFDSDLVARLLYTWDDRYIISRLLAGEDVDPSDGA